MISSELLNFQTNSHAFSLPVQSDGSSLSRSPNGILPAYDLPQKVHQQDLSYWRGTSVCHTADWIASNFNGNGNNVYNQNSVFVGTNVTSSPFYSKNDYVQSLSSELSNQDCHKGLGEVPFVTSPFYQNSFHSNSTTDDPTFGFNSVVKDNIRGNDKCSWIHGANELILLPVYDNQTGSSQFDNTPRWVNRNVEQGARWNSEPNFLANKNNVDAVMGDNISQGLSLSLSSHQSFELKLPQYHPKIGAEDCILRDGSTYDPTDMKAQNLHHFSSCSQSANEVNEILLHGVGSSSSIHVHRPVGPLGPFTGYATILKNSKFLKPAQQLLDRFFQITGSKLTRVSEMYDQSPGDACPSHNSTRNAESKICLLGDNSGLSTSSLHKSSDTNGETGEGNTNSETCNPLFQRKKAKLLCMHDEVCRRYKQYHQQMQMVVSSFESVAGLSAATPYSSSAIKTVSKHFRCLKNVIFDQLRHISMVLGEEFVYPEPRKYDITSKIRYSEPIGKQKSGENLGFLESQSHVWRPQRGLPERAVTVLRAWLFDHFLHPYPTDTDKHMLATQTGLSRNQVSNWFINARVRLWRPMVDDISKLESKETVDIKLDPAKNDKIPDPDNDQSLNTIDATPTHLRQYLEKRSKNEKCGVPCTGSMGLNNFITYDGGGYEMGGAVSLTLGLHQSGSETGGRQQQFSSHFGEMINDFVG